MSSHHSPYVGPLDYFRELKIHDPIRKRYIVRKYLLFGAYMLRHCQARRTETPQNETFWLARIATEHKHKRTIFAQR